MTSPPIFPGAPGVYEAVASAKPRVPGVRMDVCAFVGVSPRGPARVPRVPEAWGNVQPCVGPEFPRRRSIAVPVESFAEYRRLYGGYEGPGRLPYAVNSFFAQGGRRAYVVRIVHDHEDDAQNQAGVAAGIVNRAQAVDDAKVLPFRIVARNEGRWGNSLRAAIGYSVRPLGQFIAEPGNALVFAASEALVVGDLLRLTSKGESALAFVVDVRREPDMRLLVRLDRSPAFAPTSAELLTGRLEIEDGAGTRERHEDLGLSSTHPRWIATVLCYASELVYPDASWSRGQVLPEDGLSLPTGPTLPAYDPDAPQFTGGEDRHHTITPDDFIDAGWTTGDGEPGDGLAALAYLVDLATIVVPDLYMPEPLAPMELAPDPGSFAGPKFAPCVPSPPTVQVDAPAAVELERLRFDPATDLAQIIALQTRIVRFVEEMGSFVLLLDVPPGLTNRQILRWRAQFSSSFVAAYHPWIFVAPEDDLRDRRIRLNPSAAAAGILARQELAHGVPHGPAGVLVAGAIDVDELVGPRTHAELHGVGINVYLRERGGVWLSAGRTLAAESAYRQLSVRRLMLLLRRTLVTQTQWAVFEPNTPQLRRDLIGTVREYLRQLFRAGAFRGANEAEAFFVRCDEALNPRQSIDAGRMIVEVGVAPAEPLEFLVLRLVRGDDGTLAVEI